MPKSKTYEEFVEKFKPKKTTDDCYTPPGVYAVIKDWACKEYGIDPAKIVRPFYPGGDYENFVEGLAFDDSQDAAKVKEQKEALVSMLKEKVSKEYEKKGGIKDIEILSEQVAEDGNTAVVKTKYTYGNGETEEGEQQMVKKDGKWLMSIGK